MPFEQSAETIVAGAAGSLLFILIGGFRGAFLHRVGVFVTGTVSAVLLGPALAELIFGKAASPQMISLVAFGAGALGLMVYSLLAKARISASIAGVKVEANHDQ